MPLLARCLALLLATNVTLPGCDLIRSARSSTLQKQESNTDLHVLAETLEDAHPNLYFHESRKSFQRSISLAQLKIDRGETPSGSFRAIAPVLSAIGDGHTFVSPYTKDYLAFRDGGGLLFPLELRVEAARAIVTADYDRPKRVPEGTEIRSISGEPTRELLTRLRSLENGETPEIKDWNSGQDIRELLWIEGVRAPYVITENSDRGAVPKILPGCTIDSIHRWDKTQAGLQQLADYRLALDAHRKFAILTVHDFDPENTAAWQRFLHVMVQRLRGNRIPTLIVDIRENDGGSTERSDELLETFAKYPFRDFSSYETKVSHVTKEALGHDKYVDLYGEDAWSEPDGTTLTYHPDLVEPLAAPDRFTGTVLVVIGSGTFSTAAIFAAAVQDSRNGRIGGRVSGGYATLFGERFSFVLPKSRLTVSVSTKRFVRAGGSGAPLRVVPDLVFQETPQGSHDAEIREIVGVMTRRH